MSFYGVPKSLASVLSFKPIIVSLVFILAVIPAVMWIWMFNKEHRESKEALFFSFIAGATSSLPVFFYQKLFLGQAEGNFIFFKAMAVNFQSNIIELFGYQSMGQITTSATSGILPAIFGIFFVYFGVGAMEEIIKQVVVNKNAFKYVSLIVVSIAASYMFFSSMLSNYIIGFVVLMYLVFLYLCTKFIKFKSIDDVIEVAIISGLGFSFVENILYFSNNYGSMSFGSFAFFVFVRVPVVSAVHMLCSGILGYYV